MNTSFDHTIQFISHKTQKDNTVNNAVVVMSISSFLGGHACKQQVSSVQEGEFGVKHPVVPPLGADQYWSRTVETP